MRSLIMAAALTIGSALIFVPGGGALALTQAVRDACDKAGQSPDAGISACSAIIVTGDKKYSLNVAYNNRCWAYDVKGEYDRAIADCDQALRLSQSSVTYNNRCWAYQGKGEYDRAIADCDQSIRMDPKNTYAYGNRGNSYYDKGDFDRSIQDYDRALQIDANNNVVYQSRGNAYYRKGDYDRSITDYDIALQRNPRDTNAYISRGNAYYAKKDYARAITDYDSALRVVPNSRVAFESRGNAYYFKADYDRAIADYDQAIRLDPNSKDALRSRAHAYYFKGDYDRALAGYEQVMRLNPQDKDALQGRGNTYYKKGDYDLAVAEYERSIQLKPDYAAYNGKCVAYIAKGDYTSALSSCDDAIRLNPQWSNPYSHRGWAYFNKGDNEHALADLNEAVRLDAKYVSARVRRGQVLLAMNNASPALEDFNEALRLEANSIAALWGRGQVYEQQRLRTLALADYKKAIELRALGTDDMEAQNKARARLVALENGAPANAEGSAAKTLSGLGTAGAAIKPPVAIGRRVALVIGNGAYKAVGALPNPRNDAGAVAAELKRLGFEVIEKYDLGVDAMRRALGEFEDKATGADWALVYYAGHGMELNGKNWLIPIDAQLARASDIGDEAVPLDRVLERLSVARKLRIVVLDACRNNPFVSRMAMGRSATRAVSRGLGTVEPSHGEVVFYAARDGNVALDGTSSNSPFAAALVKHMEEDGVELGRFFRKVTSSVLDATGQQQEPFVYGRLPDEDYFFKPPR